MASHYLIAGRRCCLCVRLGLLLCRRLNRLRGLVGVFLDDRRAFFLLHRLKVGDLLLVVGRLRIGIAVEGQQLVRVAVPLLQGFGVVVDQVGALLIAARRVTPGRHARHRRVDRQRVRLLLLGKVVDLGSPLSPLDQYATASNQFNAVSSAATAGDYNSASQLSTVSVVAATSGA
jgi:hypothetical protein